MGRCDSHRLNARRAHTADREVDRSADFCRGIIAWCSMSSSTFSSIAGRKRAAPPVSAASLLSTVCAAALVAAGTNRSRCLSPHSLVVVLVYGLGEHLNQEARESIFCRPARILGSWTFGHVHKDIPAGWALTKVHPCKSGGRPRTQLHRYEYTAL